MLGASNLSNEEPENKLAFTTNSSDPKIKTVEGYQEIKVKKTLANIDYEETNKTDFANKTLPMIERQCNNIHNDTKNGNEKYGSCEVTEVQCDMPSENSPLPKNSVSIKQVNNVLLNDRHSTAAI